MIDSIFYSLGDLGVSTERLDRLPKAPPVPQSINLDKLREDLGCYRKNKEYVPVIKKLLRGKSFAEPGSRNNTRHAIGSLVGFMRPDTKPKELAEIFRPSLLVWAYEPGATKTVEEEMALVVNDIKYGQIARKEEEEKNRQFTAESAKAFGVANDTEEALETFIKTSIIQHRSHYYARNYETKKYEGPFSNDDSKVNMRDLWKDAPPSVSMMNEKGNEKYKSVSQLAMDYGTGACKIICDLTLQESYFDAKTKIFYEAPLPRRVTEARFDSKVDEYLRVLGGNHYLTLCKWLAAFPKLKYPLCGLYLEGNMSIGKGLIPLALARIHGLGSPSNFADISRGFNADTLRCPIVVINEGLPEGSGKKTLNKIRELIGESDFQVNEKFMPLRSVHGCIRIMITANNPNVLNSLGDDRTTQADIEAVTGRLIHIKGGAEAARWLELNNPGRKLTESWVNDDIFAKHVLELERTTEFDYGKRFLLEGEETVVHRNIALQGERDDSVLERIVRFCTKPSKFYQKYAVTGERPLAFIGNGKILVNAQAIHDCWDAFGSSLGEKTPSASVIGRTLARISSVDPQHIGKHGEQIRYRSVHLASVLDWCRENQIGDEDSILENFKNPIHSSYGIDSDWNVIDDRSSNETQTKDFDSN